MKTYITKNEADTISLAKSLAKNLKEKDILVLSRRARFRKNKVHRGYTLIFRFRGRNLKPNIHNSK